MKSLILLTALTFPFAAIAQTWDEAVAQYKAAGYSLDYDSFIPKPIPEDQNYAAVPFLRGITIPPFQKHPSGIDGDAQRSALEFNPTAHFENPDDAPKLALGEPVDLQAWAKLLAKSDTDLKDPPAAILKALDEKFGPMFTQSDAYSTRPQARLIPYPSDFYNRENPAATIVPHFTSIVQFSKALTLRAIATIHSGDQKTATASLRALFLLNKTQSPPTTGLIETVVAAAQFNNLCIPLHEALSLHTFDDATLASFQNELSTLDFTAHLYRTHQIEALLIPQMRKLFLKGVRDPEDATLKAFGLEELSAHLAERTSAVALTKLRETFLAPLKSRDYPELKRRDENLSAWIETAQKSPKEEYHQLAAIIFPSGTGRRVAQAQAIAHQAQIACALERHFLKHKTYPNSLETLVPDFLKAIPEDPIDRKPMRYRQTKDGSYLLYSIGWNESDENGTRGGDRRLKDNDWVWCCRSYR